MASHACRSACSFLPRFALFALFIPNKKLDRESVVVCGHVHVVADRWVGEGGGRQGGEHLLHNGYAAATAAGERVIRGANTLMERDGGRSVGRSVGRRSHLRRHCRCCYCDVSPGSGHGGYSSICL